MRKFLPHILTILLLFTCFAVSAQVIPIVNNVRLVDDVSGLSPANLIFSNGTPVRIHADIISPNEIKYVRASIKNNSDNNIAAMIPLYDDGLSSHGDDPSSVNGSLGADDGVYSALWLIPYSFKQGTSYSLLIEAADGLGNIYNSDQTAPELIFFTSEDQVNCTVGEIICGGNLIQQCALDVNGIRYWQTNTDCGLDVCCGVVCCNNGEICSAGNTCLSCNNLCDGSCQDANCADDPDCSGISCCGDGSCDAGECSNCPADCAVADCCGNGICDSAVGENTVNCSGDCVCQDADNDGHTDQICGGDDCDDFNPNRFPGNPEICDGIDNDCNPATIDGNICDNDNDNYCDCSQNFEIASNLSAICSGTNTSSSFWWNQTCDCNDNNININPDEAENCANGVDDDCDGDIDNNDLDCQPNNAPSNPILTIVPPMINSGEATTITFSATGNITYYRYYYCEGVGC
ncbi:putative metal-binding motif-containing protein, partial [bacterium]|nr:putative metal-binding motif-containing protein [bacterium]